MCKVDAPFGNLHHKLHHEHHSLPNDSASLSTFTVTFCLHSDCVTACKASFLAATCSLLQQKMVNGGLCEEVKSEEREWVECGMWFVWQFGVQFVLVFGQSVKVVFCFLGFGLFRFQLVSAFGVRCDGALVRGRQT